MKEDEGESKGENTEGGSRWENRERGSKGENKERGSTDGNNGKKVTIAMDLPKRDSQRDSISETSEISNLSFKHWHKHMQTEHERLNQSSFLLWKWCNVVCKPCRWFDGIEYERRICKCCLKFRTFKNFGTILLFGVFFYIFMYSVFEKELLPGGTIFFLFVLFLAAYFSGYLALLIGLPTMIGHLATGILFQNIPEAYLPHRNEEVIETLAQKLEELFLVIALIRAGLLLDLSRIKNRIQIIIRLAILPVFVELFFTSILGHYLLHLPWEWGALQGAALSIISLASMISIMEKNRIHGYGEDKHLSTVLIAASALNVICCLFIYAICIACIFPEGKPLSFWSVVLTVLTEVLLGMLVGSVAGLLVAFFPDKRNAEAAALRILMIGIASFAIGNAFHENSMSAAAALSCLTMALVAGNMWEELGWHKITNPVQYFYSMTYYFGQPFVISLVGFTMDFVDSNPVEFGYSAVILIVGLVGRAGVCFFATWGNLYPTTMREKLFICIAWCSKGTFQALLTFTVKYIIVNNKKSINKESARDLLRYSEKVKQTIILGILLTTPLVCYSLSLLSPKLLTKPDEDDEAAPRDEEEAFKLAKFQSGVNVKR